MSLQHYVKSLCLCLDILQEMVFYHIHEENDRKKIKISLIEMNILKCSFVKAKSHAILCSLASEKDYKLISHLCLEKKIVKDFIRQLEFHCNVAELLTSLKIVKSLLKNDKNYFLFKSEEILPLLESLIEMYPKSKVEDESAELICHLLTYSNAKQDSIDNMDQLLMSFFQGNF